MNTEVSRSNPFGLRRLLDEARLIRRLIFDSPSMGVPVTDYEKYWEERLSGEDRPLNGFQMERADWVAARIRPSTTVLDIGCGDGGILMRLREKVKITPFGADVSPTVLRYLEKRNIPSFQMDLNGQGLDGLPACDHILLFEILEHLQSPETLLKAAIGKARQSVFFSIPNTGYFPYRLRMLFGSFPVQWRVHPGEHIRFWTLDDIRWWIKELKYDKLCEVTTYRGIPLMNRLLPGLFGMGIIGEIKIPLGGQAP